jgi:hypothetical protein
MWAFETLNFAGLAPSLAGPGGPNGHPGPSEISGRQAATLVDVAGTATGMPG